MKGRPWTVSIALPGSILDGSLTVELKTYLVGQIARACVLFNVDEIVIYNESAKGLSKEGAIGKDDYLPKSDPNLFMGRVLQYLETPLYLRKLLFPMHRDLKFAGLLNPLDPPHHVHQDERSLFREGVVIRARDQKYSIVNCGMRKEVLIDRLVPTGSRVTVRIHGAEKDKKKMDKHSKTAAAIAAMEASLLEGSDDNKAALQKYFMGTVVSPKTPREETGYYWGYQVRLADSISKVFTESPFPNGYDLTIGTSDKGTPISSETASSISNFSHALVVFGGATGIETAVEADEDLKCDADEAKDMFDFWLNTCPSQGSRVIRTEEAILITMATLQGTLASKGV
ncbi:putative RNA methyltransferase [Lobosporangium transversale]|uniref:Putative RNA methyltransferase n=1 Tax=Lobosporangium transversale TaxID=64571 RepID=A0A1Y2GLV8_9FUNG|nr:putative RNA methyltransferase [Lobosporangium transversale]ORZ13411.1 putative RNA methyltransferase [Lobosporangium transversale]|eukprot:XP_021880492.1 putative RNA methyltransferase [Lobosporangium transversale]